MNDKPKSRVIPAERSPAALQATRAAQLASGELASARLAERTLNAVSGELASVRLAGKVAEMANGQFSSARWANALASGQLASARLASEMASSEFSSSARWANVLASGQLASARLASGMASSEFSSARLARTVAEMADWAGKMTAFPMAETTRRFPSLLADENIKKRFAPLLESIDFEPSMGATTALADWAVERLSDDRAASSERFAELTKSLAAVELDEDSERQLELLSADEPAVQAVLKSWELRDFIPKTRGDRLAVAWLVYFAVFQLILVGMIGAPVPTGIALTTLTGAWGAARGANNLMIKYSPEAESQLDTMGRKGLSGKGMDSAPPQAKPRSR